MKTNYRLLYVIILLAGFVMAGCDEEEAPDEDKQFEELNDGTDDGSDDGEGHPMYFPPSGIEGWDTKSAIEMGWDTASLNDAIRFAKEKGSFNLLIIHKGKMVVEKYWRKTDKHSLHDINSVAKSMTAFVIGVLQQQGKLHIDDKISKYLPAGWSQSPNTEAEITIRHLLTMTSGLNDDLGYAGRPDVTWRYSHEAYKVLFSAMEAATGMTTSQIFESILFSKQGITNYAWSGSDLASPARDLAKFGVMILNRGVWNGQRLIEDDAYFSSMLSKSQEIQEAYGYLWWLNGAATWFDNATKTTMTGPIAGTMPGDSWIARGKHDQRIYVVPSLEMVVVRQGNYTALPESGEGSFDTELWRHIMKAINGGT